MPHIAMCPKSVNDQSSLLYFSCEYFYVLRNLFNWKMTHSFILTLNNKLSLLFRVGSLLNFACFNIVCVGHSVLSRFSSIFSFLTVSGLPFAILYPIPRWLAITIFPNCSFLTLSVGSKWRLLSQSSANVGSVDGSCVDRSGRSRQSQSKAPKQVWLLVQFLSVCHSLHTRLLPWKKPGTS